MNKIKYITIVAITFELVLDKKGHFWIICSKIGWCKSFLKIKVASIKRATRIIKANSEINVTAWIHQFFFLVCEPKILFIASTIERFNFRAIHITQKIRRISTEENWCFESRLIWTIDEKSSIGERLLKKSWKYWIATGDTLITLKTIEVIINKIGINEQINRITFEWALSGLFFYMQKRPKYQK